MNFTWLAAVVFLLGMAPQIQNKNVCDHAAPPPGMRWQCSEANSCDCRLVPRGAQGGEDDIRNSAAMAGLSIACRVQYFVLPEYPEAALKARKQGSVSAVLVLNAGGEVQEVRVQSGDPVLASSAQMAFKQWRFSAGRREESIPVSVRFELSDRPAGVAAGASLLNPVVFGKPTR